jgi:hypothetical protein
MLLVILLLTPKKKTAIYGKTPIVEPAEPVKNLKLTFLPGA